MKNFVKPGNIIEFTAAADVESGEGVLLGAGLFGYSANKTANGEKGSLVVEYLYLSSQPTTWSLAQS